MQQDEDERPFGSEHLVQVWAADGLHGERVEIHQNGKNKVIKAGGGSEERRSDGTE